MPVITLPDGSRRQYDHPVTVAQVAADIGPGLARAALAGKVNGRLVDCSHLIEEDAEVAIITDRDAEGLEIIRHSTAHLLAQAVKQLFPEAQVTIGPVIEDGFYYDFYYEKGFHEADLQRIEKRMQELARADLPIERSVMPREEAIRFFRDMGEEYKARIIEDLPLDEEISLYRQGEFVDLCRGPHVPSTGRLGAFKLTKLAGAYWRGDASNEMLQRIYGTAWASKKDLKAYLRRLEEAEKRDHRRLAKVLDLFHTQEEAPGMVFWHDHGWTLYRQVEEYIRGVLRKAGYQEVRTPQLVDLSLWERSGHLAKFGDEMFVTHSEHRDYAVKPMNCPCHVQIYNQGLKSYRDLPLRMAEFGSCHRKYRRRSPCSSICCARSMRISVSTRSSPGSPPAPNSGSERTPCGTKRSTPWNRRSMPREWRGICNPAKGPSTDRRSSSLSRTAWAGSGSAAPSSWISPCRGGSTPPTSRRMAAVACR